MSIADELNKMIPELKDAYDAIEEMGGTVPEEKNYKNLKVAIDSIGGSAPDPHENAYAIFYTPDSDKEWDWVDSADSVRAVMNGSSYWPNSNGHTNLKFTEKCQELTDIVKIGNTSATTSLSQNIRVIEGLSNFSRVTEIGTSFLSGNANIRQITDWPANITKVGTNFLKNCTSYDSPIPFMGKLTTFPDSFLYKCYNFNQPLDFSKAVTIEGNAFNGCNSLNQSITFPSTLSSIGIGCFSDLISQTQPVTFNSSATTSVDSFFLSNCRKFTGPLNVGRAMPVNPAGTDDFTLAVYYASDLSYVSGITITGTNASTWRSYFPNLNGTKAAGTYRKLV